MQSAITHARNGDRDGITYLYARYADEVASELHRLGCTTSMAEAIAGAVFAELSTTLADYDPQRESFRNWILGRGRQAAPAPLKTRD